MKKIIILLTITAVLGTTNAAKAWWGAGAADLSATVPGWPSFSWGSSPKKAAPKEPSPPQHYVNLIELIKQQLEINKQQLKKTEETHKSVTENRKLGTPQLEAIKTDHTSFFLKDPQWIYNENNYDIFVSKFKSLSDIIKEEKIPDSIDEARKSIEGRKQYAAIVDKAVSLRTFQESENRFKQISELIEQINVTTDLKGIAELQARIKGMLAMVQNETAKLQMVAHSRNAEQALISQQKQKRNMRILNSRNTEMPKIR
ncbi:type IV secretion system protein [Bartonella vinsonii]|uniref:P-type DNA transfer protein VirB5 n=1 Tax=Bartonella vinsonii TaxID=33047 RepID=A0A448V417_BARVI|nr:type IV secretion system protein [Bartonella vinsonii]VEJ44504.1 P-type DNA transfer protein VirB5 [Bartonella vinsonii]